MKCTSCGTTNLVKAYFPLENYGEGGASVSKAVDVYLCLECGHYEFYSQEQVNAYKTTVSIIKEMEQKIANLRRDIENLQRSDAIQNEIKVIETQLSSLDITIRQQQELKEKHYELTIKLKSIPSKISRNTSFINDLESELSTIKRKLEHGVFLDEMALRDIRHLLERS